MFPNRRDMKHFDEFVRKITNPLKFKIMLLRKLPAAYFCGIRLNYINDNVCYVTVKYNWMTKNPFKSTYFACLAMAAEMSTGMLVLAYSYKSNPKISTLVTRVEGNFSKKAKGKITFKCTNGKPIAYQIDQAVNAGRKTGIMAASYGIDEEGKTVASFEINWSFSAKLPEDKHAKIFDKA